MRGTRERVDGGGKAFLLILCALLLAGSGGAVAAVSDARIEALTGAFIVVFLAVAALAVFAVHHARNPSPEGVVMPRELPGPERPAIGPREVHQHTHYHWHEAEAPAEIMRQHQAE